jgi:ribonuclease BN (tRNA processing enzyme)
MDIQFLGSGDAFGSGGRFNTCFHVTVADGSFLVDCGASSLIAMRKFGVDPNRIHTVFVSFFPGSSTVERKFSTDIVEIDAGQTATINGVIVTAYMVEHACGAPPFALRLEADGKVLAYTGDTEWTDNLIAAGRDADLLIAEALVFERRVKFHLDYASLKLNLARIGARRVILTHMGPDMLAHISEASEEIAEDGKIVAV